VYAADPDLSKALPLANHRLAPGGLALAIGCGLLPFMLLPWPFLLAIPPVLLLTWRLSVYFTGWIGGYTGDCLGAIQQVSEMMLYLGFILIGRWF
jgi:adenosylcobinamide-GDP ribazoletransferase